MVVRHRDSQIQGFFMFSRYWHRRPSDTADTTKHRGPSDTTDKARHIAFQIQNRARRPSDTARHTRPSVTKQSQEAFRYSTYRQTQEAFRYNRHNQTQ